MREGGAKTGGFAMRTINVGVVGCGQVAQHVYLPEFHRLHDKATLVAVCDRVEERARAAQQRFGARTYYTDLDHFLRESNAEIVVNLTPHQAHVAVSMAALSAGRHVYTEKPLAQSVDDATHLIDAAETHRVKLACAPIMLLLPTVQRWQHLLHQGTIGRATFARAQLLAPATWDGFSPDQVWYFAAGSGPLMDGGVYALTALTGLFGPALRVSAMAGTIMSEQVIGRDPSAGRRLPMGAEDSVHLHVDFGGLFAALDVSWCVQASRNVTCEVYGEYGTLSGHPTYANTPIHIFRPGRAWTVEEPTPRWPRDDDWVQGVVHLVDCVRHDTAPINSATHARHVLDIMLTALRSAREGRALALQTTFSQPMTQ
jgi:predicted dehydrogenase